MQLAASSIARCFRAAKPLRLHQCDVMSSFKKPRMISTNSVMRDEFAKHADYLNEFNDKREKVIKASRDVTINSKKVIFQVHRVRKDNSEEVLSKAEKDLASVTSQYMSKLVEELQGTDFWKLRHAYTFAVQEYVEAATFCRFCREGTILDLKEINTTLHSLGDSHRKPLQISTIDYLLGNIYRELTLLAPIMDDSSEMKKKLEVMLQSVTKIENACFNVHVRGSEFIPLLGENDDQFPYMGLPYLDS
ncbi:hypothetical protein HPP92_021194 [Vanilla planifolia]|uniref:Translin-associated protein X n=1 Tax=Vanilla planifolia TaxID=51239 RepID=A0A835UGK5_VANPL|nr:hypothetical protein HPP92_021194 [Vanilla planifolia]